MNIQGMIMTMKNGYIRCTHMVGGMKVNQTVGLCIIIKVKQDG